MPLAWLCVCTSPLEWLCGVIFSDSSDTKKLLSVWGCPDDRCVPALFGGLAVVFISKNLKLAVLPVLLMLLLFIFVPALNSGTVGIMVPVGVLFTVGVARIMYKKGML